MAGCSALVCAGTLAMIRIEAVGDAYLAAGCFGLGLGGVLTLLSIAWADYFGRASYGAIRGVALSMQVLAQATGPLISGALRDWSDTYVLSLELFAILASLATLAVLAARPPRVRA